MPEGESAVLTKMETEKESSKREGLRTTTLDEYLANQQKFWDELKKGLEARLSRREMDFEAAACLVEGEDEEPGFALTRFRNRWNDLWSGASRCGDFEDTTLISPMRYTDVPPCDMLHPCNTLEVFSAKVAKIAMELQWPLDVFGIVAVRDNIDQNRNIIFQRSSLNCQTLTEKDSNLILTGPTRPVVMAGPVFIEVDLKVKGTHEDKTLFSRVLQTWSRGHYFSSLRQFTEAGKFSTLEFTLGHIVSSLEATISVQIIDGSWPDGFRGEFAACTISPIKEPVITSAKNVNHKEIILLGFGHEKGPVTADGVKIELSRRVVCVQENSKLEVSVKAWRGDNRIFVDRAGFTAKESGRSYGKLEVASCKMEVTVAWSLVSSVPEIREDTILKNNRSSS